MSKQTEALKLALEALSPLAGEDANHTEQYAAYHAIREALAEQPAQQQEPDWLTGKQRIYLAQAWAMLDDYALDQRSKGNDSFANGAEASSHEIKVMLSTPQPAQQEPEPVKFKVTVIDDEHPDGVPLEKWGKPAQRTWVGLSDDELWALWNANTEPPFPEWFVDFKRSYEVIEAKIKEKNT